MNVFERNSDSTGGWRSNGGEKGLAERMEWSSCGSISNRGADSVSFAVYADGMTMTIRIGESAHTAIRIEG